MASLVTNEMEDKGVKFHHRAIPLSVEKLENGQLKARWINTETKEQLVLIVFYFFSFAISRIFHNNRVVRGNPVLKHSVPHALPYFGDIAC